MRVCQTKIYSDYLDNLRPHVRRVSIQKEADRFVNAAALKIKNIPVSIIIELKSVEMHQ